MRINTVFPDLITRLRLMLLGWGSVGVIYFTTGAMTGPATVLAESAIDRLIAYNPSAIWPYLAFFVLIPYAYLRADLQRARWLARSMPLAALVCGLVFVLMPTTLIYPEPVIEGAGGWLLQLLLQNDSSRNCLPSLHAALTLLCVWALFDTRRKLHTAVVLLVGAGICFSVVQLRRHLTIDMAAGWLAGLASGLAINLAAPALRLQRGPTP